MTCKRYDAVKKLQGRLGVKTDGSFGSVTLQKFAEWISQEAEMGSELSNLEAAENLVKLTGVAPLIGILSEAGFTNVEVSDIHKSWLDCYKVWERTGSYPNGGGGGTGGGGNGGTTPIDPNTGLPDATGATETKTPPWKIAVGVIAAAGAAYLIYRLVKGEGSEEMEAEPSVAGVDPEDCGCGE